MLTDPVGSVASKRAPVDRSTAVNTLKNRAEADKARTSGRIKRECQEKGLEKQEDEDRKQRN